MGSETDQIKVTLTERQIDALDSLVGVRASTRSGVAASIIGEWLYHEGIFSEVDQNDAGE